MGTGSDVTPMSGTSFSSPAVAGAAALAIAAHPTYKPADIKALLVNTTAPVQSLDGIPAPVSLAGSGRIQADRAVESEVTAAAESPAGAVGVSFGAIIASSRASFSAMRR